MIKTHSQQEKTLKHKNKVLIQEAKEATTMAYKTKAQLKVSCRLYTLYKLMKVYYHIILFE